MARSATLAWTATTGRDAEHESFPVASILLAPAVRPQVMAFYRFARAADDIADDPTLSVGTKLDRLDALERALAGQAAPRNEAHGLREALSGQPHLLAHAETLLQAFRRDALIDHCHDWNDLATYCQCSAVPVGRFLLDLHGVGPAAHGASDALCMALQVLNHLQDCAIDYLVLGRVYLPSEWLAKAGADWDELLSNHASPALRGVFDHVLDHVDGLLDMARPLPGLIGDRRLRLESAIVVAVAERLAHALRRRDPLAERVRLSAIGYGAAVAEGLVRGAVA